MESAVEASVVRKTSKKRLSHKQIGFARDIAMGKTQTEAALNNYDIESSNPTRVATVIGSENLAKPDVIQEIARQQISLKDALVKQGITPERVAERVDRLLRDDDGGIVDKGLKHATAIYGIQEQGGGNSYTQINVFNAEMKKTTEVFEEQIKKQLGYAEDDKEI